MHVLWLAACSLRHMVCIRTKVPNVMNSGVKLYGILLCHVLRFQLSEIWREYCTVKPVLYNLDISNRTNRIPRVNEHEHRVYNVIDNDLHTMWMSMTGLDNINITFTFPRQVIVSCEFRVQLLTELCAFVIYSN